MSPENITDSMVGHLSSEADSSLASQEISWLVESRKFITIKKINHFFLS